MTTPSLRLRALKDGKGSQNGNKPIMTTIPKNTKEQCFARLLVFIETMAIALRKNSAFVQEPRNLNLVGINVMWLSDALCGFGRIGQALLDNKNIVIEIDQLITQYEDYLNPPLDRQTLAKQIFKKFDININEGLKILKEMKMNYRE